MMDSQVKLRIYSNPEAVAREFADFMVRKLESKPEAPLFWALSGGSTPKILFRLLSNEYQSKMDWSRIHFFWGDERCVPHDHPESNYGEAKRLLLDHIPVEWDQVHPVNTQLEPEEAAQSYADLILRLLPRNTDGVPIFTINMLGMGGDGHTASIFPDNMDLLTESRVCAVAEHPESGQKRVTLTGPTIMASENITFLVTGPGKTDRIAQIFNQKADFKALPAAQIKATEGTLYWFLDEAAAAQIDQ